MVFFHGFRGRNIRSVNKVVGREEVLEVLVEEMVKVFGDSQRIDK